MPALLCSAVELLTRDKVHLVPGWLTCVRSSLIRRQEPWVSPIELYAGVEADSTWSLQILRVERLDAPFVDEASDDRSGARRLRVPFRVGDPPQGDDPLLLSSGLAGFLGALNRTRGEGSATKV